MPSVFASTFTYAYTKLRGQKWVEQALRDGEGFPAAETAHNLRRATEGEIRLYQSGNTLITQARSRAAGEFLRSDADVWVSFDDDALVGSAELHALIESAREKQALVGMPVVGREGRLVGFTKGSEWDKGRIVSTREGEKLYPVSGVGWTAVAVARGVVETIAHRDRMVWVTGGEGDKSYPACFLETVHEGWWVGEDYGFSLLCELAHMPRYILLNRASTHAGVTLRVTEEGVYELDSKSAARLGSLTLPGA